MMGLTFTGQGEPRGINEACPGYNNGKPLSALGSKEQGEGMETELWLAVSVTLGEGCSSVAVAGGE